MSNVMMESFQRFDLGDFDLGTKRPIQTDNEWREFAGNNAVADTTNGPYTANIAYHTMGIYQDPIIASKKRLGFAINPPNAGQNQSGGGVYGLERLFSAPKTKYVVGFLARFKLGAYIQTSSYNAPQMFEFCAAGRSRLLNSATMQLRYFVVGGTTAAAQSVFGADNANQPTVNWAAMSSAAVSAAGVPTFRMKGAADPNAAGIQLKYDTDHFFEVEVDITNKTLKVWVDDVYAGAATWNDTYDAPLANGFQIRHGYCFGQNFVANADLGGVYISDIYCNDLSDTVTPNTRLGKTTRVMGEAPDTDVATMFTRPDTFNSNNDVINDPIANTATPTNYLSGDGAGTEDMYQTANSIIGQFAGQVYAVQIHARYQNASGSSHTMAITAQDAATKTENSLGNVAAGSGIQMKSVVLNKTPSGENWTPAKAAALKYGFKIVN
jgi:hypothetical protein